MRTFYLIILVLVTFNSIGQKHVKSDEPYISKSGMTFTVGDEIYLLEPFNFENKYHSFYKNKSLSLNVEALRVSEDLIFRKRYKGYSIKRFLHHANGKVYAILETSKFYFCYLDIEDAILKNEIANNNKIAFESIWGKKTLLTDSIAFLEFCFREETINNDLVKEYMYLFNNTKYNLIREDEFEFHKSIRDEKASLETLRKNLDSNIIYTMAFSDFIGNYDFDLESFPILWNHNGTQIYSDVWEIFTPEDINENGVKLTDLRISFNNTEKFKSLPLNMDKANSFIKFKKGKTGNVDREIFMYISFRIKEVKDGNDITNKLFYGEKYLVAEIESIDFFASDKNKYLPHFYFWLNRSE
jgi:hypothetical protein